MYQSTLTSNSNNTKNIMSSAKFAVVLIACTILAVNGHGHGHGEDNGPANYKFDYSVHDPHTGDIKEQYEERDGHVVKGAYSFHEADGTKRIVEYVAGPHTGFNAVVKRVGNAHHPQHYHKHGGASSGGEHGGAHSSVGVTHFGYHH